MSGGPDEHTNLPSVKPVSGPVLDPGTNSLPDINVNQWSAAWLLVTA